MSATDQMKAAWFFTAAESLMSSLLDVMFTDRVFRALLRTRLPPELPRQYLNSVLF